MPPLTAVNSLSGVHLQMAAGAPRNQALCGRAEAWRQHREVPSNYGQRITDCRTCTEVYAGMLMMEAM